MTLTQRYAIARSIFLSPECNFFLSQRGYRTSSTCNFAVVGLNKLAKRNG